MPFFVPLAGMAGVPGDYYSQFHAYPDARGHAFVSGSTACAPDLRGCRLQASDQRHDGLLE